MSENENPSPKLKLAKNTDTNRFKVDGNPAGTGGPAPVAPMNADPGATQTIADPINLRDTATGRLRKISESDSNASAIAPGAQNKKETIRLKVVRAAPKPQVAVSDSAHLEIPETSEAPKVNLRPTSASMPKLKIGGQGASPSSTMQVPPPAPAAAGEESAAEAPKPNLRPTSASMPKLKIGGQGASPSSTMQVPPPVAAGEAAAEVPKPGLRATSAAMPKLKISSAGAPSATMQVPPPAPAAAEEAAAPVKPNLAATAAAIPKLKVPGAEGATPNAAVPKLTLKAEPAAAPSATMQVPPPEAAPEAVPVSPKTKLAATAAAIPKLKVSSPTAPAAEEAAPVKPKPDLAATVVAMPRPKVGVAAPTREEATAAASAPVTPAVPREQTAEQPAGPGATVKLSAPQKAPTPAAGEEAPKKLGLKLKKNEAPKPAEPAIPPGLEAGASPAAGTPESAGEPAKPEAAPQLTMKEQAPAEAADDVSGVDAVPVNDGTPGLPESISSIVAVVGAACAVVFFTLVMLNYL